MSEPTRRPRNAQFRKERPLPPIAPETLDARAHAVLDAYAAAGITVTRTVLHTDPLGALRRVTPRERERTIVRAMTLLAASEIRPIIRATDSPGPVDRPRSGSAASEVSQTEEAARATGANSGEPKLVRPPDPSAIRAALRALLPTMPDATTRELYDVLAARGVQLGTLAAFATGYVPPMRKELGLQVDPKVSGARRPSVGDAIRAHTGNGRSLAEVEGNGSGPRSDAGGSEGRAHMEAESSPASAIQCDRNGIVMPQEGSAGTSSGSDAGEQPAAPPAAAPEFLPLENGAASQANGVQNCAIRQPSISEARATAVITPLPPLDFRPAVPRETPPAESPAPLPMLPDFRAYQYTDGTWHVEATGPMKWILGMVEQMDRARVFGHFDSEPGRRV